MQPRTLTDAAAAPAALTAFLRGVERRGALFAQLQCGDRARGDEALAVAMRAFRNGAALASIAEWPRRFWALLLAAPPLRDHTRAAQWPVEFAPLAGLGNGPRAALLLRLVAGLPEAEAAAVLGIARPTYRLALQRALPRHGDGLPDDARWQTLGEAVQQTLRQLPAERLAYLARIREAAILGGRLEPQSAPRGSATRPPARPRWWWPALAGTATAAMLALTATFVVPRGDDGLAGDIRIRVRPLPPADTPAATFDAASALITHRDFELLVDDANVVEWSPARDPGFAAWLVAQAEATRGAGDARSNPLANATALPSSRSRRSTGNANASR